MLDKPSLNASLGKVKTYVNEEDGKLHFIDALGADSVLPFNNNNHISTIIRSSITETSNSGFNNWNVKFNYIDDSSNFQLQNDNRELKVIVAGNYRIFLYTNNMPNNTTIGVLKNGILVLGNNNSADKNNTYNIPDATIDLNYGDIIRFNVDGTAWSGITCGYYSGTFISLTKQ